MATTLVIRFSVMVVVLTAGALAFPTFRNGRALAQGSCQGDITALATTCGPYVSKAGTQTPPSQECCNAVRGADLPCICQNLPKEAEQILDMKKVVYVADFCGKPLGHGTKCGSYTVP